VEVIKAKALSYEKEEINNPKIFFRKIKKGDKIEKGTINHTS